MPRYTLDQMTVPAIAGMWSCAFEQSRLARWPAIKVRRDSDNDEKDIWFRAGRLDVEGLLRFCGAASGLVVTAYDRTANRFDLSQASTSLQPIIVNAGTLVTTSSGVPDMDFSSSRCLKRSDALGLTGAPDLTMAHVSSGGSIDGYPHICSIGRHPSTATAQTLWVHLWDAAISTRSYLATKGNGPDFTLTSASSGRHTYVGRIAASARVDAATLRQNGIDQTLHSIAGNGALTLSLPNESVSWGGGAGAGAGDLRDFSGKSNCFAIFNSVLSGSDLTALEFGLSQHV